jgi:predicted enzyme related to lactoylglutathione lyase
MKGHRQIAIFLWAVRGSAAGIDDRAQSMNISAKILLFMPNPFVHVELSTTNVPKAKAFYGKLFKWKMKDLPMADGSQYTMIDVGEGTGGGSYKISTRGVKSAWMPYVLVADIDKSTKQAKKLGAKIVQDVTEVMGMGWLSVLVDPTGAKLGLWEPK